MAETVVPQAPEQKPPTKIIRIYRSAVGGSKRLATSKTAWLTTISIVFGTIMTIDKGIPILSRWFGGARSGAEEILTRDVRGELEALKTKDGELAAAVTALRDDYEGDVRVISTVLTGIQVAQADQREMIYQVWSDVRQMRGLPPPEVRAPARRDGTPLANASAPRRSATRVPAPVARRSPTPVIPDVGTPIETDEERENGR